MKKPRTVFICQNCGSHSLKWLGRCPGCGEWDTLIEETETPDILGSRVDIPHSSPVLYQDIEEEKNRGPIRDWKK